MYDILKTTKRLPKHECSPKTLRKQGQVPGVIYGKGMESLMVQVELKELKKFFSRHKSKVFEVTVEGDKKHLVSLDKVEKNHIGSEIMHVSFHHLEQNQETSIMIPVVMTGAPVGVKKGGIINQMMQEVQCTGKPGDLPDQIEVDCSHLDIHEHISLKDITPPHGVKFHVTENEQVLFSVIVPKMEITEEPETVETEAVAAETPVSDEEKSAA